MGNFSYIVRDKEGRLVTGVIEGEEKNEIAKNLINQGMTPIKIHQEGGHNPLEKINLLSRVPSADKVLFAEELAALINAGVPISQALSILLAQTKNKKMKSTLTAIVKDVEGGLSLSSAIGKHPDVFSPVFVNMIKSGEIGGTLDDALNQLAVQLGKDHELTAKIKGAMYYPMVIMIGMVGAVIYLMLTIIPQLSSMFAELGGDLPVTTKSLIFLSKALTQYGIITFILVASFIYGFRWVEKNVIPFRKLMHRLFITLPPFKNLVVKMNIAHFARTLSSLLKSGVSVVESLTIVAESTPNLIFKEAIQKAADKVTNGVTIAEVIKTYPVFPSMVSQMISVGEETGSLDTILGKVADFYEREVDDITKNLSTLLEPLMMIIIGIMVGYVIISIITPIYQMTNMF